MRFLAMMALGLVLAGCAQQPVLLARPIPASEERPTGYLVGTIGRAHYGGYPRYQFSICQRDFGEVVTLQYKTALGLMEQRQIAEDDYYGESFAVALPAGEYEICGSYIENYRAEQPLPLPYQFTRPGWQAAMSGGIPLKVEAGKLNYIGRYKIYLNKGYTWSIPTADGGFWVVTDQQATDLPYVLQKNAPLASLPVVSAVPPKDKLSGPDFLPALPADYKSW